MFAAPRDSISPRGSERMRSIAAVALVHLGLAYALLFGLAVPVSRPLDAATKLIEVTLIPPPPPPQVRPTPRPAPAPRETAGAPSGPSPIVHQAPTATLSPIALAPAPGGRGAGGSAAGNGTGGGGTGGEGGGEGTDLEWISGSIEPSDYPKAELRAGIGGRVEFRFTVGVTGRVTDCTITRSSGDAELDATTCRVVMQRFRYRPSIDAAGRPIPDEVDGDHLWSTDRSR